MLGARFRFVVTSLFAVALLALNGRAAAADTRGDGGDIATYVAALRAGVQPPSAEPRARIVAVAVADLDADGDLDVVASDGSLDLLVWDNDGSGHLTRKYPKESRPGGWVPQSGSIDDRPVSTTVMLLPRDGGADTVRPSRLVTLLRAGWRAALPPPVPDRVYLSTRNPRAPPSTDSLN